MQNVHEQTKSDSIKKIIELGGNKNKLNKNKPTIDVVNYTMKFKKFLATKNVSFKVGHGVIHGFIGPNGSGKTTTIKAMIGAYVPTSGKLLINGYKSGTMNANKLIGYIPEKAAFPKHLNAILYLKSMAELSGIKPKIALRKAKEVLKILGLSSHSKRKPKDFSSGMQKKVLLAQALLTDPQVLILDEPAANLDPTARKDLFDQLIALRDSGKTILISSHILAELERIVDEVTFIYYGEIIYSGEVKELSKNSTSIFIRSDDNEKLAQLLNAKNIKTYGDKQTEIEIRSASHEHEVLEIALEHKIKIYTFRSNDLFSAYESLVIKAQSENLGKQELKNSKVDAVNKVER